MKLSKTFKAAVIAAAVGATGAASFARAETAVPAATTADQVQTTQDVLISGTGRNVIAGIGYAKAAIADGETDAAKEILTEVTGLFGDQDGQVMMKTDDGYALPLDTALSVAEGFTPTEAHGVAFQKAQAMMQNGNVDEVITTLTNAGVDLVAQVMLLPYTPTVDTLQQAVADLDAGKLDAAQTALDAIPASVHVATFETDALPTQGYDMTEVHQG